MFGAVVAPMSLTRVHRRRTYYWLLTGERTGPSALFSGFKGFLFTMSKNPVPVFRSLSKDKPSPVPKPLGLGRMVSSQFCGGVGAESPISVVVVEDLVRSATRKV